MTGGGVIRMYLMKIPRKKTPAPTTLGGLSRESVGGGVICASATFVGLATNTSKMTVGFLSRLFGLPRKDGARKTAIALAKNGWTTAGGTRLGFAFPLR